MVDEVRSIWQSRSKPVVIYLIVGLVYHLIPVTEATFMDQRTLAAVARSLRLSQRLPERPFRLAVTDSRSVGPDDLFFALTGAKVDGHTFLVDIAAKGAAAAVVAEHYKGPDFGLILIKVPNVLEALQTLAKHRIDLWQPHIVAVTGSVGKTTTKEFIGSLLAGRYAVAKAPGNANSQVGLPISILNMACTEDVLVIEMGMTEAGNIAKLIAIAPPTISVITKIGLAHSGNFADGIEGVARAKAEILAHPQTKKAIIGKQAWAFAPIRETGSCSKITAGCAPDEAHYILHPGWLLIGKTEKSPKLELPFSATHFLEDFSIAAATARTMGVEWEEMIPILSSLQSTGCRFAKVPIDGATFINDTYNAGPESVRAALDNMFPPEKGGRKIAVLGGMTVDLGPKSDEIHREVARHALERADVFFCYGPGSLPMKEIFEGSGRMQFFTEDMEKLRAAVFSFVRPGDVVLVKGANRYAMWQLLDGKPST